MGNRANVVFESEDSTAFSPAIYLHWNGGPESVYAFLQVADQFNVRKDDLPYRASRFCQIVGNFLGGTLSLGLQSVSTAKDIEAFDPGDNGTFVFAWIAKKKQWRCRRYRQLANGGGQWLTPKEVQQEHAAALKSDYWKGDRIVKNIVKANKVHFNGKNTD